MTSLIICDVGGEFDCLMRLIAKAPKVDKYIFVGDLNDRGPKSKEVIEWCMSRPDVVVLDSNHGDMFVDAWHTYISDDYRQLYHPADFISNGGGATLFSYGATEGMNMMQAMLLVPPRHISWLSKLPLFYEEPGLIVSHAPIPADHWTGHMDGNLKGDRFQYVWNRDTPVERPGLFQVFGHNSHWGLQRFGDWAICLDTTRKGNVVEGIQGKSITALHWPTKELYTEPHKEVTDEKVGGKDPEVGA